MSLQTIINYNVAGNFTFDANLIEVTTKAILKLQSASQVFSEDFADDTGFTHDNTKTEFAAGLLRQINNRLADATFGATYTTNKDGSWGDGSLTGTLFNGATVSGGKLVLEDVSQDSKIEYVATSKINAERGAIKMKITPGYSGAPPSDQIFFQFNNASGNERNLSRMKKDTLANGAWRFDAKTNTASSIVSNLGYGTTTFVDGVQFELEYNWDFTNGAHRLYINGVEIGSGAAFTQDRDDDLTTVTFFKIGDDADFSIEDLVIYDAVQHTANYTPGYTLNEQDFVADLITLPAFTHTGVGSILTLTSLAVDEADDPRYIIDGKFWNGSAWVTSDDTFAQANTLADVNTNIAAFDANELLSITVKIVMEDSNTLASVDNLVLNHTGTTGFPTSDPTIKVNSGILMDALDLIAGVFTEAGSDRIGIVLDVGGVDKYHDGSNWVNSDCSFLQSNTIAEINTNKAALDLSTGATVKVKLVLHSDDGQTTPDATSVTVDYDFFVTAPAAINECIVYIFKKDLKGDPVVGCTFRAIIKTGFEHGTNQIVPQTFEATTDALGYAELSLIQTATVSKTMDFEIETLVNGVLRTEKFPALTIPNKDSESFTALV